MFATSRFIVTRANVPVFNLLPFKRDISDVRSSNICPNMIRGIDHIKEPRLNKGLAFSLKERQALGIHGILAPRFSNIESQVEMAMNAVNRYKNSLNQYVYLSELREKNEKLFFNLIDKDVEKFLPILYTPTVGLVCQRLGVVYRRPRGIYITIYDKGHVIDVLRNWPERDIRAICVTDGERILGLGDLGAYGMGIPIGKLTLYTALGMVKPYNTLPITLDVGTDNKELIEDPFYIGLRIPRIRGEAYFDLVDEFMHACVDLYGHSVLIQFEDFALPNAAPLLNKYIDKYVTFNDDIQGTASVAVAGLIAATRITKKKMTDAKYMFLGAGSAANGIANLIVQALIEEGMSEADAVASVFMFDVDGLVTSKRPGGVPAHAKRFGKDLEAEKNFEKCVRTIKPSCLIGCSTVGGSFTPGVLQAMAENAERPIIFALSNPTSQAECTAQEAYDHTEGRCVFASGSPFPPVSYKGKEYTPGQGNNSYIFPGVALGVIACQPYNIPNHFFLVAAKETAKMVTEEDLSIGRVYPSLSQIKDLSFKIAVAICNKSYDEKLATVYPRPVDMVAYVMKYTYDYKYTDTVPTVYDFPEQPEVKIKSIKEALTKKHTH